MCVLDVATGEELSLPCFSSLTHQAMKDHKCSLVGKVIIRSLFLSPKMKVDRDKIITRGAEAEVWKGRWRERDVIIKKRVKKGYRHPRLDRKIRKLRVRKETRLLREARKLGIPVPIIYDVNVDDNYVDDDGDGEFEATLVIKYFKGDRMMDCIEEEIDVELKKVGKYIGKLHEGGITHGDLTTSNILFDEKKGTHCFIDFSLGEKDSPIEMMGVDLHLLRESILSVHDDPLHLFEEVITGYKESCSYDLHNEVLNWVEKIEGRGRYR